MIAGGSAGAAAEAAAAAADAAAAREAETRWQSEHLHAALMALAPTERR